MISIHHHTSVPVTRQYAAALDRAVYPSNPLFSAATAPTIAAARKNFGRPMEASPAMPMTIIRGSQQYSTQFPPMPPIDGGIGTMKIQPVIGATARNKNAFLQRRLRPCPTAVHTKNHVQIPIEEKVAA